MKRIIFLVLCMNILLIPAISETCMAQGGDAIRRALRATEPDLPLTKNQRDEPQKTFTVQEIVKILEEEDASKSFTLDEIMKALKNASTK